MNSYMKRAGYAIAAVVLLTASGITTALAANTTAAGAVSIGNCTTEGDFVSCSVQGDISRPSGLTVQVWAVPAQSVSVYWGDSCSAGATSGYRSGDFTVTAGTGHRVTRRIPLAAGSRGMCTPDVTVSLGGTGRLHVYLNGTN